MVAAMQMTHETPKGRLHSRIGFKLQRTARVFEKCIELSLRHSGLSRVNWCILLALHEHNLTSPWKFPTLSELIALPPRGRCGN